MWIVRIALTRPYTFIVAALVIVLMSPIVLQRTPTDVFPNIDIPMVSICWNYAGVSPQLMEDRIVSPYERFLTTVVDNVEMNGSPDTLAALNNLPIKTANGATIYVKDVAYVADGFSPRVNIARMDGQRGVILAMYKTGYTSTLDVVSQIYAKLPIIKNLVPPQTLITPLFDPSIFVRAAIQGVVREGVVAACLTALMILLFLGSWRSTLIIAISIPLSILVSITCLSALHETINLITLGGLALAVGILVDDAIVAIENIEQNLAQGAPGCS